MSAPCTSVKVVDEIAAADVLRLQPRQFPLPRSDLWMKCVVKPAGVIELVREAQIRDHSPLRSRLRLHREPRTAKT
jgi:hypothetical protein